MKDIRINQSGRYSTPWVQAGVSRSSWYRYLQEFRSEVESQGVGFLVDILQERMRIRRSLAEASGKIVDARKSLRMKR